MMKSLGTLVRKMSTYSYSRISTYYNCPYQFKLRYLDKIKTDKESIEAFMGSRVHEVLERLWKDKSLCKETSLDDLLSYYITLWDKKWHAGVKTVRKSLTPDNYKGIGSKAICEYYHKYHPFEGGKILGLEKRINISLDGSNYSLIGFIDRLMLTEDGRYEIIDYKTSGRLPTQRDIDADGQLPIYQIAVEDMWDDTEGNIDLVWYYLKFDKELRSRRTSQQLENLKNEIIEKINVIESTENFEPKESALCAWCQYADDGFCPLMKHSNKVEQLSLNEFLNDSGVQLVNQYVQTENELKELEKRKVELKNAIFRYSDIEGIRRIVGSEHSLKIGLVEQVTFPSKDTDEYIELVELLKHRGVHNKATSLDRWTLNKRLTSREWDSELIEEVNTFKRISEQKRIYISKLKDEEKYLSTCWIEGFSSGRPEL